MRNKRLQDRISQARRIISHEVVKGDLGIFTIRVSVFRCFLSLLEKDAGLVKDDLGATAVWNKHLFDLSEEDK